VVADPMVAAVRRWSWPAMGSVASLAVAAGSGSPADQDRAHRAVVAWFAAVEQALSAHRADSDLCRWRRGEVAMADAPLLAEVAAACRALAELTGGGFHPVDPQGRYDPTGYVKGWAVQRGAALLVEHRVTDACLGVGGDLQVLGQRAGQRPWRVAVVDPNDHRRIVALVQAPADPGARLAVATSGSAQRGAHIWPGQGEPAAQRADLRRRPLPRPVRPRGEQRRRDPLASVTVVGPELHLADAFATAVWARALDEPLDAAWAWLAGTGYEGLAVSAAGRLRRTEGLAAHLR
jgi:thiamine biosynthesis lipoprotein